MVTIPKWGGLWHCFKHYYYYYYFYDDDYYYYWMYPDLGCRETQPQDQGMGQKKAQAGNGREFRESARWVFCTDIFFQGPMENTNS